MFLRIIFLVVVQCGVYTNETQEDIISYTEYKNRVNSLFENDIEGNFWTKKHCNKEEEKILEFVLTNIYEHFKGNNIKLASFTTYFLVKYSYNLDNIIRTNLYYVGNQDEANLGKKYGPKKHIKKLSSSSLSNKCSNITLFEREIYLFDTKIKEYSFDNLVRLLIPKACRDIPNFEKAQSMEKAYYTLKMGNGMFLNSNQRKFQFENKFIRRNNQCIENIEEEDSAYDSSN